MNKMFLFVSGLMISISLQTHATEIDQRFEQLGIRSMQQKAAMNVLKDIPEEDLKKGLDILIEQRYEKPSNFNPNNFKKAFQKALETGNAPQNIENQENITNATNSPTHPVQEHEVNPESLDDLLGELKITGARRQAFDNTLAQQSVPISEDDLKTGLKNLKDEGYVLPDRMVMQNVIKDIVKAAKR